MQAYKHRGILGNTTKVFGLFIFIVCSAVARVSEAPPEISRGAPHTLLAYYYELQ